MTEQSHNLAQNHCQPCEGIGRALTTQEAQEYLVNTKNWQINPDGLSIARNFQMKNFMSAVEFIDKVAQIAEDENHHPDIHLTRYRNLKIELSTHALKGLTINDFILAAKINALPVSLKG